MHPLQAAQPGHMSIVPTQLFTHLLSPIDFVFAGLLAVMVGALAVASWWQKKGGAAGGSGRVVGVVGRMGSGKSYMAVRMAHNRLINGANVCTNFTMRLKNHTDTYESWAEAFGDECEPVIEAAGISYVLTGDMPALDIPLTTCLRGRKYKVTVEKKGREVLDKKTGQPAKQWRTYYCPCHKITGTWMQFSGWQDFATLENAVVIIDEAHLYAPSNKGLQFPQMARWKMSQVRKFKLDVYWITQHENRVNTVLKDLTNYMYHCRSFMGGEFFLAKGYEPENMRKKGKHLERVAYHLNLKIANLYDTLQILDLDDHLAAGSEARDIALVRQLADKYNRNRGVDVTTGHRLTHTLPPGAPSSPKAPVRPARTAQRRPAPAPVEVPARTSPCPHEKARKRRMGTCTECGPVAVGVPA